MVTTAAAVHTVVLLASAAATAGLAVVAYRHREMPGATWFAALMVTLTNWSFTYAVAIHLADPGWRLLVNRIMWFSFPTVPLFLFLFALSYTGHDDFITRRTVALVGAIPAIVIVAAWTNHWHHLLWTDQQFHVIDGMLVAIPSWGPLFWVNIMYGYGIEAVAIALFVRLVWQSEYLYADQSALLLAGVLIPAVANLTDIFLVSGSANVDYTSVTFSISGLAFGYAVFRRQLFDLIPATRALGRNAAISQLDTGVVVVDTDRRIVYCNAAAGEVLGCEPSTAIGQPVRSLFDAPIDFDAADALGEVDLEGRTYEIRTSPITDRGDTLLGHTLVLHDVTARKRRERELASQRDELQTVNDLNSVLRGVNQALVSAGSREEIERAVCDRITDADLYQRAYVGDVATWAGDDDRWTVAANGAEEPQDPPDVEVDGLESPRPRRTGDEDAVPLVPAVDEAAGTWTVVPLVNGRTVYGALGLYTDRESVSDRERAVLDELGQTIGNAIHATETRSLLSAESVVEIELECSDAADPLVALTGDIDGELTLAGLVPGGNDSQVAYLRVRDADPAAVRDYLETADAGEVRVIRSTDDGGVIEWRTDGEALLVTLLDLGAHVYDLTAASGRSRYSFYVASRETVRQLLDAVERQFPETRVRSKREQQRPFEAGEALPADRLDKLTTRQQEALEAAYRAGYFEWPRDSTAEEIAETLDITSSTLHSHLRKAEGALFETVFDETPSE